MISTFNDAPRRRTNERREREQHFERVFARRWQSRLQRLQRVLDDIMAGSVQPPTSFGQLFEARPKQIKGWRCLYLHLSSFLF